MGEGSWPTGSRRQRLSEPRFQQAAHRAFAKIIDEVNELEPEELQWP